MKFALVQLSDIHLKADAKDKVREDENPSLLRIKEVAAAVNAVCVGVPHGILVVSGDTAFSGKQVEYEAGARLIDGVLAGLGESFGGAKVPTRAVAGNHDCDFKISNSVRGIVLDNLKPEKVDDAVIAQCVSVQANYEAFAARFDPPVDGTLIGAVDRIYRQSIIDCADKKVVFHLLNSAWVSQLHEKPGSLYYPVKLVRERIAAAAGADLVVAVLHHPFNWYWPENARELRKCLEDHSDIILTGHEHMPGAFGKCTGAGEQNEYLEGGVVQETGQPDASSFNVVLFDLDGKQQQTYHLVWDGEMYKPEGEAYWRPFERNKRLTRNQFLFTDDFAGYLEDPGAGYTHPHKETLSLSDLFVYPDLQEIQYQRDVPNQPVVRSREVVSYVLNNKRVLLVGDEKAGKTSLAKTLTKDLHNNGKVAVLLRADALTRIEDERRLEKAIGGSVKEQYGEEQVDRFWNLPKEKRAAVVDDFHKASGNRRAKERLTTLLRERFDVVVLLAGEEFRFEELAAPGSGESAVWDFKQCNVLPFGHALRHVLVNKWCRLGREWSDEEAEIERTIKRAEDQITTIISIDFLPSFPVYVLILLQQLESSARPNTTSGSFGYLYEVLVTASLHRRRSLQDELDSMHTYLSEFAYRLYKNKKRALPEADVRAWHEEHCREYKLRMDFSHLWGELVAAGIIDPRFGEYKFRYKYLYFFFVARYLRDNINKTEVQEHITRLSKKLYHERSSNIMLFLCHLSKDERILDAMLTAARELFAECEQFDVAKQPEFLNRLTSNVEKLVLAASDPADNRKKALEKRDEAERNTAVSKVDKDTEDAEPLDGQIDEILLHHAAFKTIQILGQVLRNFTGSLRGDRKFQLVQECYRLGLRVLGSIFRLSEIGFPDLVDVFARRALSRENPPTRKKIEEQVSRLFFGLLQVVTCNVLRHISDSVGTEKVSQTLEEVVRSDKNPSIKVIDLSVRLDHYNSFPESQIIDLAREFSGNLFASSVVRQLVWYHLYLFRVDYRQRQRVCEKIGIEVEKQTKLIASPVKQGPSRRRDPNRK